MLCHLGPEKAPQVWVVELVACLLDSNRLCAAVLLLRPLEWHAKRDSRVDAKSDGLAHNPRPADLQVSQETMINDTLQRMHTDAAALATAGHMTEGQYLTICTELHKVHRRVSRAGYVPPLFDVPLVVSLRSAYDTMSHRMGRASIALDAAIVAAAVLAMRMTPVPYMCVLLAEATQFHRCFAIFLALVIVSAPDPVACLVTVATYHLLHCVPMPSKPKAFVGWACLYSAIALHSVPPAAKA